VARIDADKNIPLRETLAGFEFTRRDPSADLALDVHVVLSVDHHAARPGIGRVATNDGSDNRGRTQAEHEEQHQRGDRRCEQRDFPEKRELWLVGGHSCESVRGCASPATASRIGSSPARPTYSIHRANNWERAPAMETSVARDWLRCASSVDCAMRPAAKSARARSNASATRLARRSAIARPSVASSISRWIRRSSFSVVVTKFSYCRSPTRFAASAASRAPREARPSKIVQLTTTPAVV